jgi:AraC-like DNA-binding protein
MKIIDFKRHFSLLRKSFYARMLIFYSAFTVLIVLLSFAVALNLFSKNFENEINESNKRLLKQVQIYTDKYLLEKVNSIINEKFLNITGSPELMDFYSYTNPTDSASLLEAYKEIMNVLVNYDFINSIYMYRKSDDTLISSADGLVFGVSEKNWLPVAPRIAHLNELIPQGQYKLWLSPAENADYFKDTDIISYVTSIPLYSTYGNSNGFFVININQASLFKSINQIYGQDGELMVVDDMGRLFAHSDSARLKEKLAGDEYLQTVLKSNEGFITSEIAGGNCGVSWIKSAVNNWRYVSVIPLEALNKKASDVKKAILEILILSLLFSFIGLNLITSRLYRPLKLLSRKVRDNFKNVIPAENDLNYINNVFSYLSGKVDDMEVTIRNNQEVIKYKTAIDILYGRKKNETEIRSLLDLIKATFSHEFLAVMVFEMDSHIIAQVSAEQGEYLLSKTNELIGEFFIGDVECISIAHPANCITAILNFNDYDSLVALTEGELPKHLKNILGISFNISISDSTGHLSDLDKAFAAASDYLKYGYIYGYDNVFSYKRITQYEANTPDLSPDLIMYMESYLKSCKIEKLQKLIHEQASLIRENGYSYSYTQHFLLQVIGTISRVSREQNIKAEQLEKSKIAACFNAILSLDDCIAWIDYIIALCFENVNKRNISIDNDFVKKIVRYITDNIDKQVTLNAAADEFNISTSYLSRMFKEHLDISFSDFISQRKLEKARELLMEQGNRNIADIAETLGYVTPAYFSKIFKEKYGITPALYRKKMMSERD